MYMCRVFSVSVLFDLATAISVLCHNPQLCAARPTVPPGQTGRVWPRNVTVLRDYVR